MRPDSRFQAMREKVNEQDVDSPIKSAQSNQSLIDSRKERLLQWQRNKQFEQQAKSIPSKKAPFTLSVKPLQEITNCSYNQPSANILKKTLHNSIPSNRIQATHISAPRINLDSLNVQSSICNEGLVSVDTMASIANLTTTTVDDGIFITPAHAVESVSSEIIKDATFFQQQMLDQEKIISIFIAQWQQVV